MKSDCHFYNDAKKNYKIIFFCSSLSIAIDQHPYDYVLIIDEDEEDDDEECVVCMVY